MMNEDFQDKYIKKEQEDNHKNKDMNDKMNENKKYRCLYAIDYFQSLNFGILLMYGCPNTHEKVSNGQEKESFKINK